MQKLHSVPALSREGRQVLPSFAVMDFSALSMTDIVRLQNQLQQELTRRFEQPMALAFSDIVGSTIYFARFGDAAGRQLQQLHLDLLQTCMRTHEGRVVDIAGDGAFLTFPSTDAAAAAMIKLENEISRHNVTRSREHQLQVRIGIHHGPVLTDGAVVSGDAVNLCARVATSARPGEIRLTREAFQELALVLRLDCRPVQDAELKGVARAVELLALDWRDHAVFPTRVRVEETREDLELPAQDIISFGRLREHEGRPANDVVLTLADPAQARSISRWHFELRRWPDGFRLRPVSDGLTEVDGVAVAKGDEVKVGPGARIRVARVLTLMLVSPRRAVPEDLDATRRVG